MSKSNERRPYEVEVLIGTVYRATMWSENLEAAIAAAGRLEPGTAGVEEVEVDRTVVISHAFGVSTFGFGHGDVSVVQRVES